MDDADTLRVHYMSEGAWWSRRGQPLTEEENQAIRDTILQKLVQGKVSEWMLGGLIKSLIIVAGDTQRALELYTAEVRPVFNQYVVAQNVVAIYSTHTTLSNFSKFGEVPQEFIEDPIKQTCLEAVIKELEDNPNSRGEGNLQFFTLSREEKERLDAAVISNAKVGIRRDANRPLYIDVTYYSAYGVLQGVKRINARNGTIEEELANVIIDGSIGELRKWDSLDIGYVADALALIRWEGRADDVYRAVIEGSMGVFSHGYGELKKKTAINPFRVVKTLAGKTPPPADRAADLYARAEKDDYRVASPQDRQELLGLLTPFVSESAISAGSRRRVDGLETQIIRDLEAGFYPRPLALLDELKGLGKVPVQGEKIKKELRLCRDGAFLSGDFEGAYNIELAAAGSIDSFDAIGINRLANFIHIRTYERATEKLDALRNCAEGVVFFENKIGIGKFDYGLEQEISAIARLITDGNARATSIDIQYISYLADIWAGQGRSKSLSEVLRNQPLDRLRAAFYSASRAVKNNPNLRRWGKGTILDEISQGYIRIFGEDIESYRSHKPSEQATGMGAGERSNLPNPASQPRIEGRLTPQGPTAPPTQRQFDYTPSSKREKYVRYTPDLPKGTIIAYLIKPYMLEQEAFERIVIPANRAGLDYVRSQIDLTPLGLDKLVEREAALPDCFGVVVPAGRERDMGAMYGGKTYMIKCVGVGEVPRMLQLRGPKDIRTVVEAGSLYVLPMQGNSIGADSLTRVLAVLSIK